MKILNTRDIKKIYQALEEQFGNKKKLDFAFMENNKDKIFLISKDYANIDESKLRINKNELQLFALQIPLVLEIEYLLKDETPL